MRTTLCPLCGQSSELLLSLHFGPKLDLPIAPEIRHCAADNFLFLAGASQSNYERYYASVANDTCHQEVSQGTARSRISELQAAKLTATLGNFFETPRKVLDFGCGEASLLVELAERFRDSVFTGFDPGPASQTAFAKASAMGLSNLHMRDLASVQADGPYDLVIVSHVLEHLIDLGILGLLQGLLREGGLLYAEVPNPLRYDRHGRLEFLYYFDRLHVNHFTPESLASLASRWGLGYVTHFEYAFPYRDNQSEYPALGMLLRKGGEEAHLQSAPVLEAALRYIQQEQARAEGTAKLLDGFEGVLVWGAGDNFYRSAENRGPLLNLRNMVVLDRRPHKVTLREKSYQAMDPEEGIRRYPWPVIVTVSERRNEICRQIGELEPGRRVILI